MSKNYFKKLLLLVIIFQPILAPPKRMPVTTVVTTTEVSTNGSASGANASVDANTEDANTSYWNWAKRATYAAFTALAAYGLYTLADANVDVETRLNRWKYDAELRTVAKYEQIIKDNISTTTAYRPTRDLKYSRTFWYSEEKILHDLCEELRNLRVIGQKISYQRIEQECKDVIRDARLRMGPPLSLNEDCRYTYKNDVYHSGLKYGVEYIRFGHP